MTTKEILEIGIQNGQYPRYLYKYRSISSLDKILINNSLWFSKPEDFNDPFDCRIIHDTQNSVKEITDYLIRNNIPSFEAKKTAVEYKNNRPKELSEIITKTVDEQISKTGVCCFSTVNDNILMWSHYSESHKGVCLKFDVLEDPDFFMIPLHMDYQNDYSTFNYIREEREIVSKILKLKSTEWSYEKEIRVIKPSQIGLIEFNKNALSEIIFGCKVNKNEIKRIKNLAGKNYNKTSFEKAELKTDKYGLNINKI